MSRSNYNYHPQKEVEYTILDHLTFKFLLKKLKQGFLRFWTAIQYLLHNMTFGLFQSYKIPWFKLSLIVIAIFIFFKKDLHFQIQMNAPSNTTAQSVAYNTDKSDQLSVISPLLQMGTSATTTAFQFDQTEVESYIKRFAKVAIAEQEKFGIPASLKMAQAILESRAGTSSLATQTNNHFGLPFESESFGSAWENWRAHSVMLTHETSKYRSLLRYGKDYKSWAKGLNDLQYSNIENYGELLINLIEQYEIYRLDQM